MKKGLFGLDREFGFFPLIPAALQNEDLVITTGYKLPRHPGTGLFVGSGAIENEGLVFGIFIEPTLNILFGVLAHCPLNFLLALFP